MRQSAVYRTFFYLLGLLFLALGLTLNTKAGLGVSAIISVSSSISEVFGYSFGNTTLGLYSVFIVLEIILHAVRDRRYEKETAQALKNAGRKNRRLVLLMDILQLPLSIVFTRVLNVFSALIPDLSSGGKSTPGDGIVQAIADCVRKEVGFTKNCVDVVNILISTFIGLFFAGHLAGVGIGTILAVIGVGRVISVFNRLFYEKMNRLACVEV